MQPGQHDEAPFRSKIKLIGGSLYIQIPPNTEVSENLDADKLKDDDQPDELEVYMRPEDGPYGKYDSVWNPAQQEEDDN